MTCPRCGKFEEADAAYCSACGTALGLSAPPEPAGVVAAGPQPTAAGVTGAGPQHTAPSSPPVQSAAFSGPAAPAEPGPVPPDRQAARPPRAAGGLAGLLLGIGAVLILANIVLQFIKISYGGLSATAAEVNGVCQSAIGQLGQAFTRQLGYSAPQNVCGKAAAIEDWKGITLWLGIALIAAGLVVLARRLGWALPSRPADS